MHWGFEESMVLGHGLLLFLFRLLLAWEQSTIGFPIVFFVFLYALTKAYVLPILIPAGVTAFMEHAFDICFSSLLEGGKRRCIKALLRYYLA